MKSNNIKILVIITLLFKMSTLNSQISISRLIPLNFLKVYSTSTVLVKTDYGEAIGILFGKSNRDLEIEKVYLITSPSVDTKNLLWKDPETAKTESRQGSKDYIDWIDTEVIVSAFYKDLENAEIKESEKYKHISIPYEIWKYSLTPFELRFNIKEIIDSTDCLVLYGANDISALKIIDKNGSYNSFFKSKNFSSGCNPYYSWKSDGYNFSLISNPEEKTVFWLRGIPHMEEGINEASFIMQNYQILDNGKFILPHCSGMNYVCRPVFKYFNKGNSMLNKLYYFGMENKCKELYTINLEELFSTNNHQ